MEYTVRRTTAAEIVAHLGCPTHTFTANKKKEQSLYAFFFLVFRTRVDYYCHTLLQRDLSSSSSSSCRAHRQKKRADRSRKQTSFFLRRFSPGGRRADGRTDAMADDAERERRRKKPAFLRTQNVWNFRIVYPYTRAQTFALKIITRFN